MEHLANPLKQHESIERDSLRLAIEEESNWRLHPRAISAEERSPFQIGRWNKWQPGTHVLQAPTLANYYTVDVLLNESYVECFRDNCHVASKRAGYGATQVAAPGQSIRCRFDRAAEAIHIFVARSAWSDMCEDIHPGITDSEAEFNDHCFVTDPAMGKLAEAIVVTRSLDDAVHSCYVESLIVAVLARLVGSRKPDAGRKAIEPGLVAWRLRRATDFIEANLDAPITLTDIATHAGLSRMHFAAQFKRSTGLAPHNFLTARRVERAKSLLRYGAMDIVDIAASVGIQSQAYFTTVFRKYTGSTPSQWRRDVRALDK